MIIKGKVWRYGDNVDTDVIIPARYLNITDIRQLASHCLEDLDPGFTGKVSPGDIIVAGTNFGCGSSREHAPAVIKQAGVACVVAASFARIFYRNAINIGLPVLEVGEAVSRLTEGDVIEIDAGRGQIVNLSRGQTISARPLPQFVAEIAACGGLINYVRERYRNGV
ncbi:MAG: 3-isopropylmalate dehydratase small subunit [Negativicutes bacterium]|nr:3-isopropylmalate dehydratase small subunit [Negativicutes bacterium]